MNDKIIYLFVTQDTFLHNENTKSNRKEELFTEERLTRKMTIKDMEDAPHRYHEDGV